MSFESILKSGVISLSVLASNHISTGAPTLISDIIVTSTFMESEWDSEIGNELDMDETDTLLDSFWHIPMAIGAKDGND